MGRVIVALVALLSVTALAQEPGVLRISVVLTDAAGNATPIARVQLLISDNPNTREPRRVRTGADGTIDIKLPPGNYTVESDAPLAFAGRSLIWTQIIDVPAGRDTTLELTLANADADTSATPAAIAGGPSHADAVAILQKWRPSIVQIWSPTRHATGFVIDARGLIATNDHAIGDATDVEVEFAGTAPAEPLKVAGRVVASDRTKGVTLIWINPTVVASRTPIAPSCNIEPQVAVTHQEKIVAMIAPILEPMNAIIGSASHADLQSFRADWNIEPSSAGGPVFSGDGDAIGITVGQDEDERPRKRESFVIPLTNACSVITMAAQKIAAATPPPSTALRTEAALPRSRIRRIGDPKTPLMQPPVISAADFDVALVTPAMVTSDAGAMSPRSFFGYWMPYVTNAPQVLFVRMTPQFGESVWKTIARGAAMTQGINLPPMISPGANFLRMRAFCGAAEVTPIHRLIIETPVQGRDAIREGLYVFAQTDFGPHCSTVRLDIYSEKAPNKADTRTIDAALFAKIAQ